MTLDILIPTYNREKFLVKNLHILCDILDRISDAEINIIISDNASPDGTKDAVESFIKSHNRTDIKYYRNDTNIGIVGNLIYVVSLSNADYIMYLGDDDYLDFNYLKQAIKFLKNDHDIKCIFPSFENISEDGERLGFGRDLGKETKVYDAGIKNIIINYHRSHQISGIILKNDKLYDLIIKNNISNLYPHMFPTGYSLLHGKCVHIPDFPFLVTFNKNKDWKYDSSGLITDMFANLKVLKLKDIDRFRTEYETIKYQSWRVICTCLHGDFKLRKNPLIQMKVIFNVAFHKNTSLYGHLLLPFIMSYMWGRQFVNYCWIYIKYKLKKSK